MNRARAALERAVDDAAPPRHQLELVEALVGAGQLGKALDRAEALAPSLDRTARRALAAKLADGAKGPSLERALALAGVRSKRRLANLSVATAAVFTIIALGFGVQAAAATSLATASRDARAELARKGPTPELALRFHEIGSRWALAPAAAKARAAAAQLEDLAADAKWFERHAGAFGWRTADPDQARRELRAVLDGAKTDALRAGVLQAIHVLDQLQQQCRTEIDRVRVAVEANDSPGALDGARGLVAHFPGWKSQWRNVKVPIRINLERPENAIVEWNGEPVATTPPLVYLALDPGSGLLTVRAETGSGWRPEQHRLELATCGTTISIALQREAGAPPIPDRKVPVIGPPLPPLAAGDPPRKGGKITIGGSVGPEPETQENVADGPGPEKRQRFEVREVKGADVQRLLGGGPPVDIVPSTGYFDFLIPELPRDGRLRLTVDVATTVRDHKIWLDHVTLRMEDTVLQHAVPSVEVAPEDPVERPLTLQNARRSVLTLDRCVGLDQSKFRAQVRDSMVQMVRDFNKREGQ
jgi:hypothetical protein